MLKTDCDYDGDYALEQWEKISTSIDELFQGHSKEVSYEDLYNKVFDLTVNGFSA